MRVRAALSKAPFTGMAAPTKCPKCDTLSDARNQKILKCGMCDKLWHHNCAGINVKSYDVLTKTLFLFQSLKNVMVLVNVI